MSFADDRVQAAKEFAQTIVVVDDQPVRDDTSLSKPPTTIAAPTRRSAIASAKEDTTHPTDQLHSHDLDYRALMKSALELGLVCSVIEPDKGKTSEQNTAEKISKIAERTDIISLDWHIAKDNGFLACNSIAKIIAKDKTTGGRARLISVYTGEKNPDKVLDKILQKIPADTISRYKIKKESHRLVSKNGLRIVWIPKFNGSLDKVDGKTPVKAEDLPNELLNEFSELSKGLLSNVALLTIAAIRSSTHHVLNSFHGDMDGPYFAHRMQLNEPIEAEEYAVQIVLSQLKNSVNKEIVSKKGANGTAIENRIRNLFNNQNPRKICYQKRKNDSVTEHEYECSTEDIIEVVHKGWPRKKNGDPSAPSFWNDGGPKAADKLEKVSKIFARDEEAAERHMREFSVLTGISAHPRDYLPNGPLSLRLGTILQATKGGEYLLCLQPVCDAVRVNKSKQFYFVPLKIDEEKFEHVVPSCKNKEDWIGLSIPSGAYAKSISLTFSTTAETESVILPKPKKGLGQYIFTDENKKNYYWVATLKQRRALKISQRIGQEMSRVGFDEYEPFRR